MPSVASGALSQVPVDLEFEKQALKKFDMFLLPQLALLTSLAYLDRTNIGNANVFGFAEGLKLKGNRFKPSHVFLRKMALWTAHQITKGLANLTLC
ncbi:unnamed protein product [Clonostachys rosea f. rosea IK726]|uniref:Uncharacterized protein n=1 Tax=Clonostachys rosea f. rosea IK726 TaxID=1349383 RepID=A0ACA9UKP8_BIOOC|nr:unnamed protein product [Clonostachys rosea f. rosea IK726]